MKWEWKMLLAKMILGQVSEGSIYSRYPFPVLSYWCKKYVADWE